MGRLLHRRPSLFFVQEDRTRVQSFFLRQRQRREGEKKGESSSWYQTVTSLAAIKCPAATASQDGDAAEVSPPSLLCHLHPSQV